MALKDSASKAISVGESDWTSWSNRPAMMLWVAATISPMGRVMLPIM